MYQHQFVDAIRCTTRLDKIVCVGRNYAEHARELNNPVETAPLLFIKPSTAAVPMAPSFRIPRGRGRVHHELEMAVLIGEPLTDAPRQQVVQAIVGVGLALDLTLRDLQAELKQRSHPWERAKAFDGACPLSPFVSSRGIDLQALDIRLKCNGHLQQRGNTGDMLFAVVDLVAEISRTFTLLPGDVVLTGTPAGVGPLQAGDRLEASLNDLLVVESQVI